MSIIDTQQKQRPETQKACSTAISRFFVASVYVGLLIGLFEAALLRNAPRVEALLYPDVRYVIWFLAPMVDMIFFGLVGLVLGLVAKRIPDVEALVAFEVALTVTFVYLILDSFHVELGLHPFSSNQLVIPVVCWFAPSFILTLLTLVLIEKSAAPAGRRAAFFSKPLTIGLSAVVVAAVLGIGIFTAQVSFVGSRVQAVSQVAPQGPNIILITMDTVRADHLSAYGYSRPTTPHLDRFAKEGVLFENAISPTSWTLAAHASIFTGLLPHQHGSNWAVPLLAAPYTLAEVLSSRGYQTAAFAGNMLYLEEGWGIAQGFETYQDGSVYLGHNLSETLVGNAIIQPVYQNFYRYDWFDRQNAQQINSRVFQWFRHRSQRPFFLFINYMDAHDPYLPPAPYNWRFGQVSTASLRKHHFAGMVKGFPDSFSSEERQSAINGYDNSLAYLDDQMGELFQFFQRSSEWQNTVIIITSDHGEAFGEHGRYTHGFDLYREVLHVPLIIKGPGVPQNLRVRHLVGTRGLFSTVLDLTGRGKTPFSTYSLARYWRPNFSPGPFDGIALSELVPVFHETGDKASISLTTQKWQYIYNSTGRQELYDWNADPKEQSDLAGTADGQKTAQDFYAQLVERIGRSTRPWWGTEYLLPLGRQGPFLHDVLFTRPSQPDMNRKEPRVGAPQAYFLSHHSWRPPRPAPSEQDLMQSLPYH